jgi:hypothetical protein
MSSIVSALNDDIIYSFEFGSVSTCHSKSEVRRIRKIFLIFTKTIDIKYGTKTIVNNNLYNFIFK